MKARAIQWKESASLIIIAKEKDLTKKYDYNVLLFNRSEKTSFMPNHAVFPGGVKESADETTLWLKYFKKFGVQDRFLTELTAVQGPRPGIFKKTGACFIEKEIGLRITAIRETFEEVGLFLCRGKDSLNIENKHGVFIEDFDRKHWQKEVHNDPAKFLQMCQQLNVIPDLWSLSEWSVWLTPASFKKRFETAFYLVTLNECPSLLREENEVATILWKNPEEFFEAYNTGEVWLPPPQCYELSRLASSFKIEEVQKFASERSKKGTTLFLPVHYKCTDGLVGILPGDDNYPDNPNEITDLLHLNKTVDEFCSNVKRCHRTINTGINKGYVLLNFSPFDSHLSPLDMRKQGSKL